MAALPAAPAARVAAASRPLAVSRARPAAAARSARRSAARCGTLLKAREDNGSGLPPSTPAMNGLYSAVLASPLAAGAYADLALPLGGQFYFLALSCAAVYLGAERSVRQPPPRSLSFEQTLAAPLLASASLFGFYLVLQYTDLDLRAFLRAYFGLVALACVSGALTEPARSLAPGDLGEPGRVVDLPRWLLKDGEGEQVSLEYAPSDLGALALALALVAYSSAHPSDWALANVVTVSVAAEVMSVISLGSFGASAALLGGLLIYDAFWVYASPAVVGANVMVTVATSEQFNGPTKLLFPSAHPEVMPFSILGAGDVVVPGLLLCLLRRFDQSRENAARARREEERRARAAGRKGAGGGGRLAGIAAAFGWGREAEAEVEAEAENEDEGEGGEPSLFVAGLAAYAAGEVIAVLVNVTTGAPQPALVFLVPCCLGTALAAAAVSGRTVRRVIALASLFCVCAGAIGDGTGLGARACAGAPRCRTPRRAGCAPVAARPAAPATHAGTRPTALINPWGTGATSGPPSFIRSEEQTRGALRGLPPGQRLLTERFADGTTPAAAALVALPDILWHYLIVPLPTSASSAVFARSPARAHGLGTGG